jgi:hypothetical protein
MQPLKLNPRIKELWPGVITAEKVGSVKNQNQATKKVLVEAVQSLLVKNHPDSQQKWQQVMEI